MRLSEGGVSLCVLTVSGFPAQFSKARRECRRAERVWRRRRLEIDKQIVVSSRSILSDLIFEAKATYLRGKVEEGRLNRQSLFKVLDKNIFKAGAMRLPTHQSRKELASSFSLYFHEKIATIRSELDARLGPIQLDDNSTDMPFSKLESFDPVSTEELIALIKSCPSKSSVLHPMPTSVLRTICTSLAPSLADLINKSFIQDVFPTDLKSTVLITLLKK